jgi:tetratricopeptide (TPR) repeat protein
MKQYFVGLLLFVIVGLCAGPALAQQSGVVKGVAKDIEGKPISGATVEWLNTETGRKYDIKTNAKGEYYSLGILPGHYKVTLLQGDKEIFHYSGFTVGLDESILDFDMKKEQAAAAQGAGLTPEQAKAQQEQAAKITKERDTVKALNERLALAKTASDAGDFDTAIAQLNDATQLDPSRDLLWAKLGDYNLGSATKQTDPAEKVKRYDAAVTNYQKAVELKKKAMEAAPDKSGDANKVLA